jgi:hypothetical protein
MQAGGDVASCHAGHRRLRQEDGEFEASLCYIGRPVSKKTKQKQE